MTLALFYVVSFTALLAAVGVVTAQNIVYAALFLLLALGAVAALFVLLFAEFLALVQVLIYGGAIIIVILFALMLTRRTEAEHVGEHRRWPFAALVSAGLFALLAAAFVTDSGRFGADVRTAVGVRELGTALFERWAIPFEVASVVLLVALVGAVVIARSGGAGEQAEEDEQP